ncbi:MAG: 50S ribosomal protein L3 [Gammaproteobacteria bacterium]|nr:MAG: 50S ribosomal protein L3 [Gammaproteobacteria bacterium]
MALGVIGTKVGMTRVFNDAGVVVPVTVLEVAANRITQIKVDAEGVKKNDGYRAVQLAVGSRRPKRVTKAMAGHYAKANVEPGRGLWEFRLEPGEGDELQVGGEIKVDIFSVGQKVDVQGKSIGKGYAGVMKRHGFRGGRKTHGCSLSHRSGGSIGQNQTPGRVFKGKKMAGQMGNVVRTQQNLEVIEVDVEKNLLLVKGAIPGAKGQDVVIRPAAKTGNKG